MTHHLVKYCHVEGPTCTIRLKDEKKEERERKERKRKQCGQHARGYIIVTWASPKRVRTRPPCLTSSIEM
jgi:hypothetical protein